jgi:hypothetical protein
MAEVSSVLLLLFKGALPNMFCPLGFSVLAWCIFSIMGYGRVLLGWLIILGVKYDGGLLAA